MRLDRNNKFQNRNPLLQHEKYKRNRMWSWNSKVELEMNVELNHELECGANLTLVIFVRDFGYTFTFDSIIRAFLLVLVKRKIAIDKLMK